MGRKRSWRDSLSWEDVFLLCHEREIEDIKAVSAWKERKVEPP